MTASCFSLSSYNMLVNYDFTFLKKSFKTLFKVSLLCIWTTWIYFFTSNLRWPQQGHARVVLFYTVSHSLPNPVFL